MVTHVQSSHPNDAHKDDVRLGYESESDKDEDEDKRMGP